MRFDRLNFGPPLASRSGLHRSGKAVSRPGLQAPLPSLDIRRREAAAAVHPGAEPHCGAALSVPVITGLCRAADLLLMAIAALAIGMTLRQTSNVPPWGEFVVISAIAIAVARAVGERLDIHRLPALLDPLDHLAQIGFSIAAGAAASVTALFLLHEPDPRLPYLVTQPLAWALASGAASLSFRAVVGWQLQVQAASGRLSSRVALIGANAASLQFIQDSAADPAITVVGIYDDRTSRLPPNVRRTWLRGDVADLVEVARSHAVDAIVISLPLSAQGRIRELRAKLAGIAADIFLTADIPAATYDGAKFTVLGASPVLCVASRPLKDWPAFKKAAFDRVASALFLLLALPAMALIAVLIKLDTRGPVLFRQDREGLNGTPFTMLKFRTMRCRPDNDEWVQATPNDGRVTRVGYWLRRYSLDELPQLWNVLRGEMSLVGPRPHLATTRAGNRLFSDVVPHYQARHRMKPGLTGWAQMQGLRGETRTEQEIVERVAQDLYYIDNWSLGLDLRIIWHTLRHEIVSSSGRGY